VKYLIFITILLLIGLGTYFFKNKNNAEEFRIKTKSNMNITSPDFQNNSEIPAKFTCEGENKSPTLQISNVSDETKSLVLIVDDPDAPAGTWTHWIVWNIDPQTKLISENNSPPKSIQGYNSFGNIGYGGPCPPNGTHHYHFKLYALKLSLDLPANTKRSELENAMKNLILDSTELIGIYSKK
jgi:Raf kinase inhibitor-like YbhB/YbcL family protein